MGDWWHAVCYQVEFHTESNVLLYSTRLNKKYLIDVLLAELVHLMFAATYNVFPRLVKTLQEKSGASGVDILITYRLNQKQIAVWLFIIDLQLCIERAAFSLDLSTVVYDDTIFNFILAVIKVVVHEYTSQNPWETDRRSRYLNSTKSDSHPKIYLLSFKQALKVAVKMFSGSLFTCNRFQQHVHQYAQYVPNSHHITKMSSFNNLKFTLNTQKPCT